VLALSAGAAWAAAPSPCIARPELTEGPYFVDEKLNRSDIRSDPIDGSVRPGALLQLTWRVSRYLRISTRSLGLTAGACTPLSGAMVDLWHCDAGGVYSDVADPGGSTVGKKFLRGYQLTDGGGYAQFTTIYPGWYPGRAVHIHFKIRAAAPGGRVHDFTSQVFFDDAFSDQVYGRPPYTARGQRRVLNVRDEIYRQAGGQLTLAVTPDPPGYRASFDLAIETV